MREIIDSLPAQIREALDIVQDVSIKKKKYSQVIICGMGGSGISGAITRALYPDILILTNNDYEIPYRIDAATLGILISYSGNTEETLSDYTVLGKKHADRIIISSDGKLFKKKATLKIKVPAGLPPRGALGYLFTPLPMILHRAGLLRKNPQHDLTSLALFLKRQQSALTNKARAIAKKIGKRLPIIYVDSFRFQPVAQRWQCQFNENTKILAHINTLPEMNHNEIVGIGSPASLKRTSVVIMIHDPKAHPRNALRTRLLTKTVKKDMPPVISITPRGNTSLQQMFWSIWLGDYISYYCAKLYNVDPLPVKRIEHLKQLLSQY